MTTSARARLGGGDGVVGDGAGVASLGTPHDLAAGAIGPLGQLLDRGGAVCVAGRDDHLQAQLALQVPGELADRGRLAGAVDPDHHQHRRPRAEVDARRALGGGDLGQDLDQPFAQIRAARDATGLRLVLEPPHHLGGGGGPDVGQDQRLLELLPGALADLPAEAGAELSGERLAAAGETLAQPPEEPLAILRGAARSVGRRLLAEIEYVPPVRRHARGPAARRPGRSRRRRPAEPTRRPPRQPRRRARRGPPPGRGEACARRPWSPRRPPC